MYQDPNWAKILDPDLNSMYLDPKHWLELPTLVHNRIVYVIVAGLERGATWPPRC